MKVAELTIERIKAAVLKNGYKWWDEKPFIGGIRTNDQTPDVFNDFIFIVWMGKLDVFEATTEPGLYYLNNPMRLSGTFVLTLGQFIDCWEWGTHVNYEALCQCKPLTGWRDSDKDNIVDPDKTKIYTDGEGVDIHHAHASVVQWVIGKYSAGCQVIRRMADWVKFFGICKASKQKRFSYTLLCENDFL